MATRQQTELAFTFDAPRELVWAALSDSNRFDRALGLAPARYQWIREGTKNLRLARASELGIALEWIEPPYEWAEGQFLRTLRRFRKGPVSSAGLEVELSDAPDGRTLAKVVAWVEAPWAVAMVQNRRHARALPKFLEAVRTLLVGQSTTPGDRGEPAAVRGKRVLATRFLELASGPRSRVDEALLASRAATITRASKPIVERLVAHLLHRPDDEVSQLRPFELARAWNADRREVLKAFLGATEAGLVDLRWQINCPDCKTGAQVARGLAELSPTAHCAACEVDYQIDFAQHVEAVFPCNAAIRAVEPALYCASSPAFLPHVFAQLRPASGQRIEHELRLPPGALLLRTLWIRRREQLVLDAPPALLSVRIEADRLVVQAEGLSATGLTKLVVDNTSGEEAALLLERTGWSAEAVLGTTIASLPEFLCLFSTDAPASGVELQVGFVALLFSDLTGSTALYEKLGDARAFALVEEHFQIARAEVERAGGAVVKTMGDAVMATFPSLSQAVAAGLAMVRGHDARFAESGLGVKVGVHGGPCLAVRANGRLDYFGTVVNVSARLQAQAGPSEVVVTESAAAEPSVVPLLDRVARRPFEAHLKGIQAGQRLVALSPAVVKA